MRGARNNTNQQNLEEHQTRLWACGNLPRTSVYHLHHRLCWPPQDSHQHQCRYCSQPPWPPRGSRQCLLHWQPYHQLRRAGRLLRGSRHRWRHHRRSHLLCWPERLPQGSHQRHHRSYLLLPPGGGRHRQLWLQPPPGALLRSPRASHVCRRRAASVPTAFCSPLRRLQMVSRPELRPLLKRTTLLTPMLRWHRLRSHDLPVRQPPRRLLGCSTQQLACLLVRLPPLRNLRMIPRSSTQPLAT